jgi:hypothetical protein
MGDFDFWVGRWEGRWSGGSGTNEVTAELGGAVVLERFDSTDLRGMSLSVHDGTEWRQTWVDDHQGYIDLRGGMDGDEMVLRAGDRRMRFTDIGPDAFVWLWEQQEGAGWAVLWKIDYLRRA